MNNQNLYKKLGLPSLLAAALLAPALGYGDVLEEIVVTAQKREADIQDVPISISALSGDQLDDLGLSDMTDITQQVPGLQINNWSPQLTIFNMRGVSQNNFVDNLEAPIAVYHDDAYVASINALSGALFDIERVEILRGPQGTLFGRNATGGLIHYISRGADKQELNGFVDVSIGSFSRTSVQAAVGGGLGQSGNLRGRIAGHFETADGYIEADASTADVDPRAIGGTDTLALRGTLEVDFSETFTGTFLLKFNQDSDVPTGGYVFENCMFDSDDLCPTDASGRAVVLPGVVSGDPHKHQSDTRGSLDRDVLSMTAKLVKEFANGIEFVSITNYMSLSKSYVEDGDAFNAPILVFGQDADVTQLSEELRFSGSSDSFAWQAGAYFMDYQFDGMAFTTGAPNIELSINLEAGGLANADVTGDGNPFDGRSDRETSLSVSNFSLFGQVDFKFSEVSTLSVGARWSDDAKAIDWRAFFTSDDITAPVLYAATDSTGRAMEASVLSRFSDDTIDYSDFALHLSYKHQLSDRSMFFASYNRGIKGGNWTLSSGVSPDRFQHGEEVLNAYEFGYKADLSDTMRLNATMYVYDYQGYQNFVAIPPGAMLGSPNPQIGNSDVSSFGAEVEFFMKPTNNLDILLGMTVGSSEVDSVDAGTAPILSAELPNNPGVSFNYLVQWGTGIRANELFVQLNGVYYGDQFLEVTNGPGTLQEAYHLANLSVGYKLGNYSLSVWSKNLTDEIYKAYSLDLGALGATTYYAPPQTTGLTFNLQF